MLIFRSLLLLLFSFMGSAMDLPPEPVPQEHLVDRQVHILAIALPAALSSWENFNKFVEISGQVEQQVALLIDHFGFDFLNKIKHKIDECCVAKISIHKDGVISWEKTRFTNGGVSLGRNERPLWMIQIKLVTKLEWEEEAVVYGLYKIYSEPTQDNPLLKILKQKSIDEYYYFFRVFVDNDEMIEKIFVAIEQKGLKKTKKDPAYTQVLKQLERYCDETHEEYCPLNTVLNSTMENCWKKNDSQIVALLRKNKLNVVRGMFGEMLRIRDSSDHIIEQMMTKLNEQRSKLVTTDEITAAVQTTSQPNIVNQQSATSSCCCPTACCILF